MYNCAAINIANSDHQGDKGPVPFGDDVSDQTSSTPSRKTVYCLSGYSMSGASSPAQIICNQGDNSGSWYTPNPNTIKCVPNNCTQQVATGNSLPQIGATVHGGSSIASCPTGMSLVGSATAMCDKGVWSGFGTCFNNCLAQTANADKPAITQAMHGANGAASCPSGKTLVGSASPTCGNGAWSGAGTCHNDCLAQTATADKPAITPATHGANGVASCPSGKTLVGPVSALCGNGNWVGAPSCFDDCFGQAEDGNKPAIAPILHGLNTSVSWTSLSKDYIIKSVRSFIRLC